MGIAPKSAPRYPVIDLLRGLAAAAVCLFHFTNNHYLHGSWLEAVGQRGYLGVDAFFVISGFVMPLSLAAHRYDGTTLPRFLLARFVRLYPAFLATLLLIFALGYASSWAPGYRGESPHIALSRWVNNLALLCSFRADIWMNPVFWTLAIEAQFYVAIGLLQPLLVHRKIGVRVACIGLWLAAPLLPGSAPTLLHFGALFGLGIVAFGRANRKLAPATALGLALLAGAIQLWTGGLASTLVAAITYACIAYFPDVQLGPLQALGTISYSLYLLHAPIGGRVINLSTRWIESTPLRVAVIGVALTASIASAALLYRLIEKPSHQLSRRLFRATDKRAA